MDHARQVHAKAYHLGVDEHLHRCDPVKYCKCGMKQDGVNSQQDAVESTFLFLEGKYEAENVEQLNSHQKEDRIIEKDK